MNLLDPNAAASLQADATGDVNVNVIHSLGFAHEIETLEKTMSAWVDGADPELRDAISWQFWSRQLV
ncbi:MAG: hypothetical protein AAF493_29050, partial [Pseudomonadota bacterium]